MKLITVARGTSNNNNNIVKFVILASEEAYGWRGIQM